MKLQSLLVTSALVISVIASAISAEAKSVAEIYDEQTEATMPGYIQEFADALNKAQLMHETSYPLSTTEVDDRCVAFMDGKMVSGEIGRALSNLFLEGTRPLHQNQNALDNVAESSKLKILDNLYKGGTVKTKYCPRYAKMTAKERSIVWVFILTAMAHFESSCKPTATNKGGPNGTAYGFYQLHRGFEANYDGDKGICQNGDAGKPIAASKCTLAMLEKQFEVREGELFSSKSYWDVLRPSGSSGKWSVIRRALMRSSLCNPSVNSI